VEIQIADHRPALTIALSLARKLDDPLLPKWQADMTNIVVEVTKKFFGSLTDTQVRKGLDATIGLLSLGLFVSTKGGVDAEAWVEALQADGLPGASKRAVALVKQCSALPEEDAIWMEDDLAAGDNEDKRRALLLRAIAMGPENFSAYRYLIDEIGRRETTQLGVKLAEWLLDRTTTGRIVKKNVEDIFGYPHPHSDEVCYHILPRLCGIPETFLPAVGTDFLQDDVGKEQDIKLPPQMFGQVRKRYDEIVKTIPAALRPALLYNGKSWFERFVIEGRKSKKRDALLAAEMAEDQE